MFVNALVARALVTRGALLWLGARLMASAALRLAGADAFDLTLGASIAMVVIATTLAFAQTVRLREQVFLANLGCSTSAIALYFIAPALLGELLVSAIGRVLH